jgi:hypothetical protein
MTVRSEVTEAPPSARANVVFSGPYLVHAQYFAQYQSIGPPDLP